MAKEKCYNHASMMPLMMGLGLLIFGGVKYLGYSWEMALMVIGILAIIKGIVLMAMKK